MESFAAFFCSASRLSKRSKQSLSFRLNLLRFSLPFEVYPIDVLRSSNNKKRLWKKEPKRALVFDIFVHVTIDKREVVCLFCLIPDEKTWKICFDAPTLLKEWEISSLQAEPLRQIGCVMCKNNPYEFVLPGDSEVSCLSLLDVLCHEQQERDDLSCLPLMHFDAKLALRRRIKTLIRDSSSSNDDKVSCKIMKKLFSIYNTPYDVFNVDVLKQDIGWRPVLSASMEPRQHDSCKPVDSPEEPFVWEKLGTVVLTHDVQNRPCIYVHPIVLAEIFNAYPMDNLINLFHLDSKTLHQLFWCAYKDVVLFGDLSLIMYDTWTCINDVLRVMLNAPFLHHYALKNYDMNNREGNGFFLSMASLFRHVRSNVANHLQQHRWIDVKAVSSLEYSKVVYKDIRYEVFISVNHQEDQKKIFLRTHGAFPKLYMKLFPHVDTSLRLISKPMEDEVAGDRIFATLHVNRQVIIHPKSRIYQPTQVDSSFHHQLMIRDLMGQDNTGFFFFKSCVLFDSLKSFNDYLGWRRKIYWMVQLTPSHELSLESYLENNKFCLM